MARKEETKALEEKVFAQAYLDNGLNATQATLAIKPHVTPESARVIGSELLERVNQSGAIDSLIGDVTDHWREATKKAIALAHKWLDSDDVQLQSNALKYLNELGKVVAPASTGPKSLTQINKYTIPKR
jgi:hypothetical protein